MIRLALAALLLASPALGFERMARADCQNAWLEFTDLMFNVIPADFMTEETEAERLQALSVTSEVTPDGWCRLTGGTRGLENARFDTLDWQAEEIDRFLDSGAPPLALRFRLRGATDALRDGAAFDVDLTMRQVPGEGLLLVEAFDLRGADGSYLTFTAVLGGAYFDTLASAQSSIGGIVLHQFAGRVDLAAMSQVAGWVAPADAKAPVLLDAMLEGLTPAQLTDAGRSAVVTLRDNWPELTGNVSIRATSERGLGWLQLTMAGSRWQSMTLADILNFALSGVTLDLDWHPVE